MKSRTLSCKGTFFKKNITRFMPFWALYIVCLMLGLAILTEGRDSFYYIMNLGECARIMAVVNCGYALLVAQLLFGDLYNSRMCSGIHSLPLRREEIFSLNILSGLLFSLVPTLLMTLAALPLTVTSRVVNSAAVPFLWFAAANLEFVFFFGLAVLCVFCAGNRFSMAVLYGILNLLGLLLYLLVEGLYMPMLPGVGSRFEWLEALCPVAKISDDPLIVVERLTPDSIGTFEIQDSWDYLFLTAGLGIVLMLGALQMYRKRALETAGDFMAVKCLKPVFLVIFTLAAGTGLSVAANVFFYRSQSVFAVVFGLVGLVIGWFVGLMLLEKTTRVFSKRNFLGMGILVLVMGGSLLLTRMDVLRIASWVPDPAEVESVYVMPNYNNYADYWKERYGALKTPEDLEMVSQIHALAIQERVTEPQYYNYGYYEETAVSEGTRYTAEVSLEYHLKNGSVRRRQYYIYADGEAGQLLKSIYSRPGYVLEGGTVPEALLHPVSMNVYGDVKVSEEQLTEENMRRLAEAILQDCREGTLAPMQEFHPTPICVHENYSLPGINISADLDREGRNRNYFYLNVYSDSRHTVQWLQDMGLLQQAVNYWIESFG